MNSWIESSEQMPTITIVDLVLLSCPSPSIGGNDITIHPLLLKPLTKWNMYFSHYMASSGNSHQPCVYARVLGHIAMCICVCVCGTCVCVCARAHVCVYMRALGHICAYVCGTCVCVSACVCIYVCCQLFMFLAYSYNIWNRIASYS